MGGFSKVKLIKTQKHKFEDEYVLQKIISNKEESSLHVCQDIKSQKQFVVKTFNLDASDGIDKQRSNARHEYEILKDCALSPYIINVHRCYESEKHVRIIQDYCLNGDLFKHLVKFRRVPETRTRKIMQQTLLALTFIHEKKLTHFDIKLENIVIDDDCNIKLIDFEFGAYEHDIDRRSMIRGTPVYLAPEIVERGRNDRSPLPSTPSDVWSAGVMMYFLLMGYPPFDYEHPNMFQHIVKARYPIVTKHWKDISPHALDLIRKMLVVNPSKRITAKKAVYHDFFWL